MAAEIRVDTIKGRAGINTLSFAGDGFSFDKNVGIGTTVVSDPVSANNPGKLACGIVTCKEIYTDGWNISGIATVGGLKLGDGEQIIAGVSSDLKIYHTATGNKSHITHSGAGALEIYSSGDNTLVKSDEDVYLMVNGTENGVYVQKNGKVDLFYDNAIRVTTTTDGADIGGTGCVGITKGTTGERPSSPAAGDFRYNTTDGKFEGYTDEWGEIGGGGGASETDVSVSSTSATSVYSVAHASYRSASIIIQVTQGSAYQTGRYLVIHDGTTATIVEESAIATGSMLATFTTAIVSTNLVVYVNMGSSSSATVTVLATKVTV